jgi:hypothetical protein
MFAALQRQMTWRAVPLAGLAAGAVYLLLMALLLPSLGLDVGLFLRYNASLLLGGEAVTSTDAGTLVLGLIVFVVLSLLYALLIAVIVHRWGLLVGIIGGALLGLCVYAINYFTLTLVFPWMYALNAPILVVGHIVFGALAGGVYEALDRYDEPFGAQERAS